jgi:hypothetical protein
MSGQKLKCLHASTPRHTAHSFVRDDSPAADAAVVRRISVIADPAGDKGRRGRGKAGYGHSKTWGAPVFERFFAGLNLLGDRISERATIWIEWGGLFLAAGIIAAWCIWLPVQFVPHSLFAMFAVLPGALGLANHFASVLPRYRSTRITVTDYQNFCDGFDNWWRTVGWPRKLQLVGIASTQASDFARTKRSPRTGQDLLSFRPMTAAAVWSSLLLTVVFMVAADVAAIKGTLTGRFPQLLMETQGQTVAILRENLDTKAINGFLFAALGAFVSVMWRMINRINANALTSRFMFTATLRTTIAMMIGLAAGQFDLFGFLKADGSKETLFFLTGLFTDWALSSLRARARTVFSQPDSACDRLPLCFVDGLDDGVIDILDEIGIWDVEHLATSEPGELTIRTLYPFNRINDWIDQAILISYFRRNIVAARALGVGGAIDLALTFGYTVGDQPETLKKTANQVLDELAKKIDLSRSVLDVICLNIWFDYTVEQLYRFWQHHREDVDVASAPAAGLTH